MATGTVLRFDEVRGYGFIAPEHGGEDVFVHANALNSDKRAYRPGVKVSFDVVKDARGLKASSVQLIHPSSVTTAVESQHLDPEAQTDDDLLCDVLASRTLKNEIITLCLESVPSMTGEQINALNEAIVVLARHHGWLED